MTETRRLTVLVPLPQIEAHRPSPMIELTHATQQALARIATAPATSEQAQRSAVAELLEVAEILARHTSRQDLADRAEAAVERVRTTLAQPKPNHHSDSNWAWVADAVAVAEQRREAP